MRNSFLFSIFFLIILPVLLEFLFLPTIFTKTRLSDSEAGRRSKDHISKSPNKAKKFLYGFLLGSRIKTWPASLVPLAMASALALKHGFFDKSLFFFTAFSILFIQIAVNLFNDAWDGKQGLNNSPRLGPPGLVGSGAFSFSQVRFMAFFSCFMATLLALPPLIQGGWPILLAGTASLCLTYLYTGSKYSLLKFGLSEITVVLFFGFCIVFGVYYLQTLKINSSLIYLSLQCGLWALSLLLINHLRDEKEDKKRGRKHVVTFYGRTHSLFLLIIIQAFIYLLCFYWLGMGYKSGAFSFFVLPLSVWLVYQICQTPPSQKYNFYLAFCSYCYILFGWAWITGLVL